MGLAPVPSHPPSMMMAVPQVTARSHWIRVAFRLAGRSKEGEIKTRRAVCDGLLFFSRERATARKRPMIRYKQNSHWLHLLLWASSEVERSAAGCSASLSHARLFVPVRLESARATKPVSSVASPPKQRQGRLPRISHRLGRRSAGLFCRARGLSPKGFVSTIRVRAARSSASAATHEYARSAAGGLLLVAHAGQFCCDCVGRVGGNALGGDKWLFISAARQAVRTS
ncbi:hypothetical protein HPB51_014560 [Rhipicephalus microplus]|uniref:Uncharacterized protein n=1 Tax=Rhipicephalus microplus TaxID=6941 RepID=A0A9J6F454_RHIMP|nr:hypothetical protein HPB51_014560 [Rhipicephalus microplus]